MNYNQITHQPGDIHEFRYDVPTIFEDDHYYLYPEQQAKESDVAGICIIPARYVLNIRYFWIDEDGAYRTDMYGHELLVSSLCPYDILVLAKLQGLIMCPHCGYWSSGYWFHGSTQCPWCSMNVTKEIK
jgi:hypothetical protein